MATIMFSREFPSPSEPENRPAGDDSSQHSSLTSAFELFIKASKNLEQQYASLTAQAEALSEDLVQAHARLEALLNALPAAVILIEDSLISHFNAAAAELVPTLETNQPWVLPKTWYPGSGPDEFQLVTGTNKRTLQIQKKIDGSRSVIQIQDITANLKTAEEKERIDRLASMGQMSAGIAHQIRTPLSTALLYCSHLCSEELNDSQRKQFSEKLQRQLIQLEHLATEMLQFIRMKPLTTKLEDINSLITSACQQLHALFDGSNVELKLNLSIQKSYVLVERSIFMSAIVSVLENAAQATADGGEILVSTLNEPGRCSVIIEDSGAGIPEEILSRLFEPFSTNRASGTGLGLAIARNTIKSHRGEISAENVPNRGARFTITLPTLDSFDVIDT